MRHETRDTSPLSSLRVDGPAESRSSSSSLALMPFSLNRERVFIFFFQAVHTIISRLLTASPPPLPPPPFQGVFLLKAKQFFKMKARAQPRFQTAS